jgi:ADP-heptose:LPS heptosyltransferase
MNILLLNLARFGDLLQTQATISGLTRQGHRAGVVCLDNFAAAAAMLSGVSHVAPVPGAAFLPEKPGMPGISDIPDIEAARGNWPDALASLAAWRNDLRSVFAPDLVCNLIPSLSSQLLTSFIAKGAPCLEGPYAPSSDGRYAARAGFFVDGHGFGITSNPWAAFLRGTSLSRGVSPFNIVDIFRKIAGAGAGTGDNSLRHPPEDVLRAAREILRAELPATAPDCRGFVALQLGASEDRRRWPVSFFVALGDILWREGKFCPVLLGSKSEVRLAERYGSLANHPYISMAGRTDLTELAALLCASRMLISNDTGTMHLAAGLGLPVLAVFLATAQPFDTGPYLAGSCSVEPDIACHPCPFGATCDRDLACRSVISPELPGALALSRLERGEWRMPERGGGSARVWLSVVDKQGNIDLQSLSGHEMSGRASWMRVQRHFLRQFLDRDTSVAGFAPEAMRMPVILPEEMFFATAGVLEQAQGFVDLMRQQGKVLLLRPVPLMRDRFMASWGKVRETLSGSPPLRALAVLWEQETQAPDLHIDNVLTLAEDFSGLLEHMRGSLRN